MRRNTLVVYPLPLVGSLGERPHVQWERAHIVAGFDEDITVERLGPLELTMLLVCRARSS